MPDVVIGLDAGKIRDHSALAVVERIEHLGDRSQQVQGYGGAFWTDVENHYHVHELRRWPLGTSYTAVIADVGRLVDFSDGPYPDGRTYFDATGVGAAVEEMMLDAYLAGRLGERRPRGVTITAGGREGKGSVPKVDLVSTLRRLLAEGRLHVPADLPLAGQLRAELAGFSVVTTPGGRWTFGSRDEATHDDLVTALALAVHARPSHPARLRRPNGLISPANLTAPAV